MDSCSNLNIAPLKAGRRPTAPGEGNIIMRATMGPPVGRMPDAPLMLFVPRAKIELPRSAANFIRRERLTGHRSVGLRSEHSL
jgi:hypothetical protein